MHEDDEKMIAAHAAKTHRPAAHQVQQWHDAIERAAKLEAGRVSQERRPAHDSRSRWFWGSAITAALVTGVVIGLQFSQAPDSATVEPLVQETRPGVATPVAFTRGLSLHLSESRQLIDEFDSSSESVNLIRQIIEQNRVFESAANQHNADSVARVLRAFEPILLRLAAEDIAPDDAEELRAQLAFELKVMLTKLAQQSSDQSHST